MVDQQVVCIMLPAAPWINRPMKIRDRNTDFELIYCAAVNINIDIHISKSAIYKIYYFSNFNNIFPINGEHVIVANGNALNI